MAGGNLSPRQKMINMMYLVLTALLALNVSKEILDSFVTVNSGLENTKTTLREKMDGTYKTFSSLASENTAKYGASWAQAQQVQGKASVLVAHIDTLKAKVIAVTENLPMDKVVGRDQSRGIDTLLNLTHVKGKDRNDAITNLMVGSEPANPKDGPHSATELKTMLEEFRDLIKGLRPEDTNLSAGMDLMFNFADRKDASGTMNNWQSINFYGVPMAAGITILSKIQTDVRNAENEIVNRLLGDVEGKTFKFSTLSPMIQSQSNYVTQGTSYEADIFLAAYDPLNPPRVEIAKGGRVDTVKKEVIGEVEVVPIGPDGKAKYKVQGSGVGERTYTGVIIFKPVGGEEERHVFSSKYEVAAPVLVVSPTKMNVFYRGVDNPVEISVPGYSAKDIAPNMTNGTITKTAEGFIVRPGSDRESLVNVTVTNPDGTKKAMTGRPFRVKAVPDPIATFGGKTPSETTISRSDLAAAQGVIARMKDFDFDLKFEVMGFTAAAVIGGEYKEKELKGNRLSDEVKTLFGRVKTGQKIYIENVKVKGPDGTIRTIGGLALKVS